MRFLDSTKTMFGDLFLWRPLSEIFQTVRDDNLHWAFHFHASFGDLDQIWFVWLLQPIIDMIINMMILITLGYILREIIDAFLASEYILTLAFCRFSLKQSLQFGMIIRQILFQNWFLVTLTRFKRHRSLKKNNPVKCSYLECRLRDCSSCFASVPRKVYTLWQSVHKRKKNSSETHDK